MKSNKFKVLTALATVLILVVVIMYFLAMRIFGASSGLTCSNEILETLPMDASGSVLLVEDAVCDDGLNVGGAFVVKLKIQRGTAFHETELLRQSNMQSASVPPSIRVVSQKHLEVTAQKKLTTKTGPTAVGDISISYRLT